MLDLMRRHAGSWMIKVILALIVGSFIFFFGYTEFQSRILEQRELLATIDGEPIPRQKFDQLLDDNIQRMREAVKGEIPRNFIESMIRGQIVNGEIEALYARSLGIRVSDEEVAKAIRTNPNFLKEGIFDPVAYHERFRPYFEKTYGEDFERGVEKDLLRDQLRQLAPTLFGTWGKELMPPAEETKKAKKKKSKSDKEPEVQPIRPEALMEPWIADFRDKRKIKFY